MENESSKQKAFEKSSVANLYRYVPTGVYYARPRIGGKLKSKSLNTDKFSVAKMRLADYVKEEHHKAESLDNAMRGKMTFGDAVEVFKSQLEADRELKQALSIYLRPSDFM